MNLVELDTALRKLRLSGMAATLDARLRQAQSERQAPIDLVSALPNPRESGVNATGLYFA